ncbi:MAG: hypothetical protein GY822_11715 [Deltaproteobacteria bacterium]|nr:hypothetical protein [Deltaproteobacteria bacterium]
MSVVQAERGASLEALFHPALARDARAVLLVPGIPGLGGGMDHAVMAELSFVFSQAGLSVLRFNFRGVGVSTKINEGLSTLWLEDTTAKEAELFRRCGAQDVRSALRQLDASVEPEEVYVVGVGFGACALNSFLEEEAAAFVEEKIDVNDDKQMTSILERIEKVAFVAAPFLTPYAFSSIGQLGFPAPSRTSAGILPLEVFAAEEDGALSDDVIVSAQAENVFPQRIAGADIGFSRGLSSLGRSVVARML